MAGEGARLSSLVENVLDFARIEEGRKTYHFAPTDMAALAQHAVDLMQPQAEAKGLRILLKCDPLPGVPRVDAGAMQQALINLLDNAVKFTPPGGGKSGSGSEASGTTASAGQQPLPLSTSTSTIQATLAPTTQGWSLTVTDPGIGIPASEHSRIFDRFYRLGNELRRETTGTGIGLAIVKHIVEGHGGVITVLSEPGRGSEFCMAFSVGNFQCSEVPAGTSSHDSIPTEPEKPKPLKTEL